MLWTCQGTLSILLLGGILSTSGIPSKSCTSIFLAVSQFPAVSASNPVIDHILTILSDGGDFQDCVVVVSSDHDFRPMTPDRQILALGRNRLKMPLLAKFLREEAFCVFGLVGNGLGNLATNENDTALSDTLALLANVPNSKVLVARKERPTVKELSSQINSRRLYWTEWTSKVLPVGLSHFMKNESVLFRHQLWSTSSAHRWDCPKDTSYTGRHSVLLHPVVPTEKAIPGLTVPACLGARWPGSPLATASGTGSCSSVPWLRRSVTFRSFCSRGRTA